MTFEKEVAPKRAVLFCFVFHPQQNQHLKVKKKEEFSIFCAHVFVKRTLPTTAA